jgi:hypothetical protein
MKKTLALTKQAFLGTLAAAMLLTGCAAQKDVQPPGKAALPCYTTAEQIEAMPPCKATLERMVVCYAVLRTTDGKEFRIGGPENTPEVAQFIYTLKAGQTYKFPSAFLIYRKKFPY